MTFTRQWWARAVAVSCVSVAMAGALPHAQAATRYTSHCYSAAENRDRCTSYATPTLASQAYYDAAAGARRMCAYDALADGHSAAVRFKPVGSTDPYRIKWASGGQGSIGCSDGTPGTLGQRWTMEACIGEYGSRILLSCSDPVVVTL